MPLTPALRGAETRELLGEQTESDAGGHQMLPVASPQMLTWAYTDTHYLPHTSQEKLPRPCSTSTVLMRRLTKGAERRLKAS